MDLLCIGRIIFDHIFNVPMFPHPNSCIKIDGIEPYFGGSAANVAAIASKLGLKTGLVSAVGEDFRGSEYEKNLKKLGVDLTGVKIIPGTRTSRSWIFTNKQNNQITYIYEGAGDYFEKVSPENDLHNNLRIMHITTGNPVFNKKIAESARNTGTEISFDPGQDLYRYSKDDLLSIVRASKFLFFNRREARQTCKKLKLRPIDCLLEMGPKVIAVTMGKKGSLIYTNGSKLKVSAATPKQIIDPTGAGDAYRAGFLAGYIGGYSIDISAQLGSTVASFIIESLGCQTNAPTWEMVKERYFLAYGEELEEKNQSNGKWSI
ncbi:MAG: carbohydrate kinase family protein [Euryarchaeota archaeon]|nr:carbohydrate kinase family protein [Euryarchaeota archaeon]